MGIEEIEKPADTPCPHLCAKGCIRYASRPLECRVFDCMWRMKYLPAWMKPNKTHAVVWPGHVEGPEGQQIQVIRINFARQFPMHNRVLRWARKASYRYLVVLAYRGKFEAILSGRQQSCGREGDSWEFTVNEGRITDIKVMAA